MDFEPGAFSRDDSDELKTCSITEDKSSFKGSIAKNLIQSKYVIHVKIEFMFLTEQSIGSSSFTGHSLWQRLLNSMCLSSTTQSTDNAEFQYQGWRRTVIAAAALTAAILLTNVMITALVVRSFPPDRTGVSLIYTGDCDYVKRMNVVLHVLINILSTTLLAASNYTMQCLSSPTRSEVNAAHSKGISLNIGVPNLKNFRHLQSWKRVLWVLLCLSSLPLHFLWNSVVFSTDASNLFTYIIANEGFLDGKSFQQPTLALETCSDRTNLSSLILDIYSGYHSQRYFNLSTVECFDRYTSSVETGPRNLILITDTSENKSMSLCGFGGKLWAGSTVMAIGNDLSKGPLWVNTSDSNFPKSRDNTTYFNTSSSFNRAEHIWRLGSYPVKYCLSEIDPTLNCKLQLAPFILYVVIACNSVKLTCMMVTAVFLWNLREPILVTVGDAVASFLDVRDEWTTGMCIVDWRELRMARKVLRGTKDSKIVAINAKYRESYSSQYNRKPSRRLCSAMSKSRNSLTLWPFVIFWVISMFIVAPNSVDFETFTVKFFGVDEKHLLRMDGNSELDLFAQIMVANLFQVIISMTYFLYNSAFTAQCGALEWAKHAQRDLRPLRVTWPVGQQKSTYFLHLPWSYSISLAFLQMLVHFFVSQSIFLARLEYFDSAGKFVDLQDMGYLTVGYSPSAMLATWIVSTGVIMALVLHSFRKIDNRMPSHYNQSAAISAMCYRDGKLQKDDHDSIALYGEIEPLSTKALMWGVTTVPFDVHEFSFQGEVVSYSSGGHCTFTEYNVELPQEEKCYY